MPADIESLENEYQNLIKSSSSNQSLISLTEKTNVMLSEYRKHQSELEFKLQSLKLDLKNAHNNIQSYSYNKSHVGKG